MAYFTAIDSQKKDDESDLGHMFGESGDVLKAIKNSDLRVMRELGALKFTYVLPRPLSVSDYVCHIFKAIPPSSFDLILIITS